MIKGMCRSNFKIARQESAVAFCPSQASLKVIVFFKMAFAAGSRAFQDDRWLGSNVADPVEIYGSLIHFEDQQIRVAFTVFKAGICDRCKKKSFTTWERRSSVCMEGKEKTVPPGAVLHLL